MLKNTNRKTNHSHCERSEAIWLENTSHPEGIRRILDSSCVQHTQNDMSGESGRSMVEMLGVLAVIGVLSITGISGYTTAMNKHRANEILDAASKRAVVVSTQLQSGRTNPTLAEFGEDATVQGVSFTLKATDGNAWATGQERFAIQTSAIDEDICREIYNTTGTSGTVREMYSGSNALSSASGCSETASAMRFVYNNDLTNTAITSDYKDQASCTAAGKSWCSNNTCAESCGPSCPSFASTSNTGDYEGGSFTVTSSGETLTCYCPTDYKYNETSDNCSDDIEETCTSWTRNECGKGKYCQFSPDGCTAPTSGVCKDITACGMADVSGTNFRHSDYGADCSPDWWTAQAICKADGGRTLVSLSDVDCTTSGCDTSVSSKYTAVRNGGFTYSFWTTDLYESDSCPAWYVADDASVYGSNRNAGIDVLCR